MDKTEELKKDDINIFHCRNCFNTPLLGIKYTPEEILIQECCKCNHKYVTNLETFHQNYKNYKINCLRCKNEIDCLHYNFCLTCIHYYCDKCIKFHNYNNTIHKVIKANDNINICRKHHQSYYAYCLDCPIPLCLYCNEKHSKHNIFNYFDEIINKEEIEKYKTLLENSKQKLIEYNIISKEIVKQLKEQVEKIVKGLDFFLRMNEYELNIINNILNMYEESYNKSLLNYEIIFNVKNILQFNDYFGNFSEISETIPFNEKIKNINLFLSNKNNYILKESSIDNKFLQNHNLHIEDKNKDNNKDLNFNISNKFFEEMKCFKILSEHQNEVYCLTILNDGRLASTSKDKTIKIYEPINFTVDLTITEHTESVYYITQLFDERLLSCSNDRKMLIIKLNHKNYFIDQVLIGHSLGIIKAIQLKNGDISSSSIDNTIKIWKENKKNNLFQCQNTISVHTNNIHSILEIPITNELVSSSNQERTLRFFNLITYKNENTIEKITPCGFMGVLYLIDNNILAVGTTIGLSLINLIEHKEIIKMNLNSIYSFFRLKSGSLLTGEGKAIQEWKNIEKKHEIHKGNVTSFAQFNNGILATCSLDKTIILYK